MANLPCTLDQAPIAFFMTIDELLARDFCAFSEFIRFHTAVRPTAPALTQSGRTLDYRALDAFADRIAASLQRDGVNPGDSIAICAGMSIEYGVVFTGALRAGVAVAPLAPSSTADDIAGMVADAGAKMLFVDANVVRQLQPLRARIEPGLIGLDECGDGAKRLADWLAPEGSRPQAVDVRPEWPFNIIYSSGTTGRPKGIEQSHAMRWTQLQRASVYGYDSSSITMVSTPLYSNTTLVSFLPALTMGGEVVLMPKFQATEFLDLAQRHRATHAMLVPVQYQRIMALPDFDRYDLSAFRYKFSTSAPFPALLKTDILRRWPGALIEYYGMTEGGGTCILEAHLHPGKLHTVGCPAPGHDIRVIDENGAELPSGATGEVVGRSGSMMTGYFKQPSKTAEVEWHDSDGNRYIRTGDIGRFDEDGFLTLMDRRKDMIISGGFNIYPSDLEAVLRGHPAIADAAVVGVPSERWGETPIAFVVQKTGAAVEAEALRAWANERLGKTQRLAAIEIAESLPRSAIGKVLKRELRDLYRERTPISS